MPERPIFNIGVQLCSVGRPASLCGSGFTAEPGQWSDAGFALMVDDIVAIILEFRTAIIIHHAGQAKACAQIQQN